MKKKVKAKEKKSFKGLKKKIIIILFLIILLAIIVLKSKKHKHHRNATEMKHVLQIEMLQIFFPEKCPKEGIRTRTSTDLITVEH
jgi:hypothetical protein